MPRLAQRSAFVRNEPLRPGGVVHTSGSERRRRHGLTPGLSRGHIPTVGEDRPACPLSRDERREVSRTAQRYETNSPNIPEPQLTPAAAADVAAFESQIIKHIIIKHRKLEMKPIQGLQRCQSFLKILKSVCLQHILEMKPIGHRH